MSLGDDVDLDEFISQKDDLSGADIRAICTEAGLMALRERRMRVQMEDFRAARERIMKTKTDQGPLEGLYLIKHACANSKRFNFFFFFFFFFLLSPSTLATVDTLRRNNG